MRPYDAIYDSLRVCGTFRRKGENDIERIEHRGCAGGIESGTMIQEEQPRHGCGMEPGLVLNLILMGFN